MARDDAGSSTARQWRKCGAKLSMWRLEDNATAVRRCHGGLAARLFRAWSMKLAVSAVVHSSPKWQAACW